MSNGSNYQLTEEQRERAIKNWVSVNLAVKKKIREKKINLATVFLDLSHEKIKNEQLIINDFIFDDDLSKLNKWINTSFEIVERNLAGIFKEINLNNRNNIYLRNVNKVNNSIKEKFELLKFNDLAKSNDLLGKIDDLILTIERVSNQVKTLEENNRNSFNRRKSLILEKRKSLLNLNSYENQLLLSTLGLMKENLNEKLEKHPNDYKLLGVLNKINKSSINISQIEIINLISFLKDRDKERLLNWKLQSYLHYLEFFLSNWNNLGDFKNGKVRIDEKEWDKLYLLYNCELRENINGMDNSSERKVVSDLRKKLAEVEANLKVEKANVLESEQAIARSENVENNLRQEILNEQNSYTQLKDGINDRVKFAVDNAVKEQLEEFNKKLKEKEEEFNKLLLKKTAELNEVLIKFQVVITDGDDFIDKMKELEINGTDGDTGDDIIGGVWDLADAFDGKKSELEILSKSLEENKEKLQKALNEKVELEKSLKEEIKKFKDTGAIYYLQIETYKEEIEKLKKQFKGIDKSSESLKGIENVFSVDKLNELESMCQEEAPRTELIEMPKEE